MRITADHDKCIGAGNCASVAPEFFDQRQDDGTVVIVQADVSDSEAGPVWKAVSLCPVEALRLG